MYAAIRRYTFRPGSEDAITRRARGGFVPPISSLPGFVAYYGVIVAHNQGITVSIFEDQASEEESTRRAADWVRQNLAEFVEGPPEVMSGEVAWHG